jgi:hypothetical protein
MIGRLRMSVDEALQRYESLAEKVFRLGKKRIGDGQFKASILEDAFKKIVREKTGNAELPMMDLDNASRTYVAVPPVVIFRD